MLAILLILITAGVLALGWGLYTGNATVVLGAMLFISLIIELYEISDALGKQMMLAREVATPINLGTIR